MNINGHNQVTIYSQQQVNVSEIPQLVNAQTNKVAELKKKVDAATAKAQSSQNEAEALKKRHWYNKKTTAINELQIVTKSIAQAQADLAEAQKVSFEYQEMLGKITQALFMLGMLNMAANRSVVQQLKLELENAPAGKLDEMAKNEIERTIGQLQAQQDILQKQDDFAHSLAEANEALNLYAQAAVKINKDNEVNCAQIIAQRSHNQEQDAQLAELDKENKEQDARIADLDRENDEQDEQIDANREKNIEQDAKIDDLDKENDEQDVRIAALDKENNEQDEQIGANREKNIEQDAKISNLDKENDEQDALIEAGISKDIEHDEKFAVQEQKIIEMQAEIGALQTELSKKAHKTWTFASLATGAVALIAAIIQFFI